MTRNAGLLLAALLAAGCSPRTAPKDLKAEVLFIDEDAGKLVTRDDANGVRYWRVIARAEHGTVDHVFTFPDGVQLVQGDDYLIGKDGAIWRRVGL